MKTFRLSPMKHSRLSNKGGIHAPALFYSLSRWPRRASAPEQPDELGMAAFLHAVETGHNGTAPSVKMANARVAFIRMMAMEGQSS